MTTEAHRGDPLFGSWFGARGVGRDLGPAPETELGQDVADVVLDGLGADEEAVGDLAVRQAVTEQLQHLAFPPAERRGGAVRSSSSSPGRRGARTERAQQRGGGID